MKLLVTNIQRFSLHDGPGIRTTVFLKGCTLHCPWCCNPENIQPRKQYYYQKKKCIAANGSCAYGDCPFAISTDVKTGLSRLTRQQFLQCKSGALGEYGEWYEPAELVKEVMRDAPFWGDDGGVTFSGGEPLMQMDALEPALALLKRCGVNLCAETALYVPTSAVLKAMKYFDKLFVDVKLLDKNRARSVLGGDLELYLENLHTVLESGVSVSLRHPLIKGYTDDIATERAIHELLTHYPSCEYQILSEHHLGDEKRLSVGDVCKGD